MNNFQINRQLHSMWLVKMIQSKRLCKSRGCMKMKISVILMLREEKTMTMMRGSGWIVSKY